MPITNSKIKAITQLVQVQGLCSHILARYDNEGEWRVIRPGLVARKCVQTIETLSHGDSWVVSVIRLSGMSWKLTTNQQIHFCWL